MSLRRAAIDSFFATIAKLAGALIAIKAIAIELGPEGMGLIGQFMSVIALLTVVTSGGAAVGLTRNIAKSKDNKDDVVSFVRTACWISVLSCTVISLVSILSAEYLSTAIFHSSKYAWVFLLGCLFLIPIGYSTIGFSIINGLTKTSVLAKIQLASAFFGALGLVLFMKVGHASGAIIGILWMSSCPILFILIWWFKSTPITIKALIPKRDNAQLKLLLKYAVVTFFSIACSSLSQIVIRSWIASSYGWENVGYWQAMNRMSDAYLQVFSVFLLAYFLPKISCELNNSKAISYVFQMYRLIIPLLFAILVVGYFSRDIVISIFLSSQFEYTRELFLPQMIGDFFKIIAFLPGYFLLARGYMPLLFIADPLQMLLLLVSSYFSTKNYGALGAVWAYCGTYIFYASISLLGLYLYKRFLNGRV